jgi:hypothetical protein
MGYKRILPGPGLADKTGLRKTLNLPKYSAFPQRLAGPNFCPLRQFCANFLLAFLRSFVLILAY